MSARHGKQRIYASDSERVAACLSRNNKRSATFSLSPEVLKRLDDFMLARDETKSQVIERALTQFFRKR